MIAEIKKGNCSECEGKDIDVLGVDGVFYCSKCYALNSNKLTRRFKLSEKEKNMQNARNIVHRMVKEGNLYPEKCKMCGNIPTQAHHEDYEKPLNVIWLCDKHHKERHKVR